MWNGHGLYGAAGDPYSPGSPHLYHHTQQSTAGSSGGGGGGGGGVLDAYRDESANAAAFAQAAQQAASLQAAAMHHPFDGYVPHLQHQHGGVPMLDGAGASLGGGASGTFGARAMTRDPYSSPHFFGATSGSNTMAPGPLVAARGKPEALAANALMQHSTEDVSDNNQGENEDDDNDESGSDEDEDSEDGSSGEEEGVNNNNPLQDQQQPNMEEQQIQQQAWQFPPPANEPMHHPQQHQQQQDMSAAYADPTAVAFQNRDADYSDDSSDDSDDDKPIGSMGTKSAGRGVNSSSTVAMPLVPEKKSVPKPVKKPKTSSKKSVKSAEPPNGRPVKQAKKKAQKKQSSGGENVTAEGLPDIASSKSRGAKTAPTKKKASTKKKTSSSSTTAIPGTSDSMVNRTELDGVVTDSLGAVTASSVKKKTTPKAKSPNKTKLLKEASGTPRATKSPATAKTPPTTAIALPANHFPRDKEHELPMTPGEQANAKALVRQFCTLPLLAEFTKPLHVLHSELSELYSKVIPHPMDLSYICGRLERGGYKYARHLQLDMWRMCSNCILFHTDSRVQKANVAIPSFVNIALHLREYFNALWEEYMIPSYEPYKEVKARGNPERDNYAQVGSTQPNQLVRAIEVHTTNGGAATTAVAVPACSLAATTGNGISVRTYDEAKLRDPKSRYGAACSVPYHPRLFDQRATNRRKRFRSAVQTALSVNCCHKSANAIEYFVMNNGRVDTIDFEPILHTGIMSDEESMHLDSQLNQMKNWLRLSADALDAKRANQDSDDEDDDDVQSVQITVHELYQHFHAVTNLPSVTSRPLLQYQLRQRLDRLLHKIIVPIYEAGCRGVNQSSIWGCMAAAIWARESSRKPYWPALVLGILAPEHQKEEWHLTLTERNEARLPEKLRQGLGAGKKKAFIGTESKKKGEQMSYFMVEFLGKHQFQWVREADILEEFDPEQDPNDPNTPIPGLPGKKRKAPTHPMSDKASFKTAVQECEWAIDEFDLQVRDPCGDVYAMDDDLTPQDAAAAASNDENELPKYNYNILAFSPPDPDNKYTSGKRKTQVDYTSTDEEGDELYATDGLLDMTVEGIRDRKARLASAKKMKGASARKAKTEKLKKEKASASKKKKELSEAKQAAADLLKTPGSTTKKRKRKLKDTESKASASSISEEHPPTKEQAELEVQEESKAEPSNDVPKLKRKKRRTQEVVDDGGKKASSTVQDEKIGGKRGMKRKSRFIDNKKARARAKVKSYLAGLIQEGRFLVHTPTPTAGPGGSMEVGGLMGMALAFRAAAGDIRGADPRDATEARPWEDMDIATATSEQERCAILQTQIELLEAELDRMEMDQHKRTGLIKVWSKVKNEFGQSLDDKKEVAEVIIRKERAMSLDDSIVKPKRGRGRRKRENATSTPTASTIKSDIATSNISSSSTAASQVQNADTQGFEDPLISEALPHINGEASLKSSKNMHDHMNGDAAIVNAPFLNEAQNSNENSINSEDDGESESVGSSVSDVNDSDDEEDVFPQKTESIQW